MEPIRIPPPHEVDALIREHIETTHFWDEATGSLYEPAVLPVVVDDEDDED